MPPPRSSSRFSLPSTRHGALSWLNQIFAACVVCYIPYTMVMPLYEGRRLVFVSILLGLIAFFLFNSWVCKRQWHGVSIAMLSGVLIAGPTILYIKLDIIMTTIWLVMVSGLISCFVVRPIQALLPATLALGSVIGAHWHLRDHVPKTTLDTELGRVAIAIILVSVLAYLISSSYKRIYRELSENLAKTQVALDQARAQQLLAAEALDAAELSSQQKSAFLASMSHHLRTPLNAILGYAEILHEELEDSPDPVPDTVWTDTERIQIASRHLLELIQDVLNLADIESGTLRADPRRFDLRALCEEIVTAMELAAKLRDNELLLEYEVSRDVFTHYDPTWVRQILFNLLSNAIKFTRAGRVTLRVTQERAHLFITVEDTGIGLTPEQLEHIFEEFVQADEETLREFGGTGLGLPLCHKLISRMDGELVITSEPGQWTRVEVKLPRGEERPA